MLLVKVFVPVEKY